MSFVARRLAAAPGPGRNILGGVVKAADLGMLATTEAILEQARKDAAALLADARDEAGAIVAAAETEREAMLAAARAQLENDFWLRARDMESRYRELHEGLSSQLEPILDRIVVATLQRLGWQAPAEVRLRLLAGEILAAAGPVAGAVLQVSPADGGLLADAELAWPMEVDPRLPAGRCRLVADNGSWTADFAQAMERLTGGSGVSVEPVIARGGPDSGPTA